MNTYRRTWSNGSILLLAMLMAASTRGAWAQAGAGGVYDDALQNGWQSWSWASVDLNDATRIHGGAKAIRVEAAGNQAFYGHHAALNGASYESLSFWINGGPGASSGGSRLQVQATRGGDAQTAVALPTLTADTWTHVSIPLSDLGVASATDFDGFWIQNTTGDTLPPFWVDDISLTVVPPPTQLRLDVDASAVKRTLDDRIYGLNTAVWDSHLGEAATSGLLGAMGTSVLRFPGGSTADDYDWQTGRGVQNNSLQWSSTFPTFARVAQARGAQAYIIVNYGSGTPEQAAAWVAYANGSASDNQLLGVDAKGRDWKTVSFWASMRGSAPLGSDDGYNFLRASHPAPYNFKYWEIGNENYGNWETDQHGDAGSGLSGQKHDPTTYADAFKSFHDKMLQVDGTIRIGAVIAKDQAPSSGWTSGVLTHLKTLGVVPHFVIFHHYPQEPGGESDAGLLSAGAKMDEQAAIVRQLVNTSLGGSAGAQVELAMTELNSVTFNPGKQTTSLVNGLFMADALGDLAETEFNAVVWWDLHNGAGGGNSNSSLYGRREWGDYGVVAAGDRGDTPLNTPYPSFYAAKLLTHWARGGDAILTTSSNYAMLSGHAARLSDGRLALLVVNKDPANALSAQITLSGFTPTGAAQVWQYGKPNDAADADLTSSTFSAAAPAFSYSFPSYSMTVLVMAGSGGNPKPQPTPVAPQNGSLAPSSSSNTPSQARAFAATYSDANGADNLRIVALRIGGLGPNSANSLLCLFNATANTLSLYNDAATAFVGSAAPGSDTVLSNSQGSLNCHDVTISKSGNTLTVGWNVSSAGAFAGTKQPMFLFARDSGGLTDTYARFGFWTIGGNSRPQNKSVSPVSAADAPGTERVFAATYSDPNGWKNLLFVTLRLGGSGTGSTTNNAGAMVCVYNVQNGKLYLFDDAGNYVPKADFPGRATTLSNSQGSLDCARTTVVGSGSTLTVKWSVKAKPAFAGSRAVALICRDRGNLGDGYDTLGTWNVGAGRGN